jgi:hypothetical protein
MTYSKTGNRQDKTNSNPQPMMNAQEGQIKVNGFEQVLAMLKIADPEFRESLLRRLAARDLELANHLRADLRRLGL